MKQFELYLYNEKKTYCDLKVENEWFCLILFSFYIKTRYAETRYSFRKTTFVQQRAWRHLRCKKGQQFNFSHSVISDQFMSASIAIKCMKWPCKPQNIYNNNAFFFYCDVSLFSLHLKMVNFVITGCNNYHRNTKGSDIKYLGYLK